MKKQSVSPVHRGILTIELLIGLVIIMLAGLYGYPRYTQYLQELEWGVAASNMTAVGRAAKSYIRDNRDTLVNRVKGGTPITVSAAELQQAGYLPAGFSLSNTAAQTYQVGIARDPHFHEKLVAFVLTSGGQEISYLGLRTISQKVEGSGGYIWPDNLAVGAFAGWEMNLTRYGLRAARGRLATWLSSDVLGTDRQESDRLYRYKVNNRPDLNRMHTDIDMHDNNLNNVKGIQAKTGHFSNTLTTENDIKSNQGWLITSSGKGWMNEPHGGGLYMDNDDWIQSVNGKGISTTGQLKGGTVHADGRLSTGEFLQLDNAAESGNACDKVGLLSRDAVGAVLSCQSGVWTALGGGSMSRAGVDALSIEAPGNFNFILVSISSKFYATDGSHTSRANFTVLVNGTVRGKITNSLHVSKGGSRGTTGATKRWGWRKNNTVSTSLRAIKSVSRWVQVAII
ncbi:hypothetical protein CCS41_13810 (plasmid) [Candidatus Fukatsuia symbiotica]|uniref:Bacterial shufflon protein N-terminal domain-containing protein n=1 Tax=Candidatus Fukatsuia symbiotica TaxID=1878942 RepID=A0A2U8I8Q6_9GAMM|nr:shufflon system plasmid conjugative transfer pilus tip adhesin PilV [Candidatus Fukatsuia symbiotica]AWK15503.1 hypothetical protein CCS41_13810 [Candidatus Fukatsuia symbiotica]